MSGNWGDYDVRERQNTLGGTKLDNFMNRLAEKITAQDIIKANSQAEAAEIERIRQEAEQYRAQMDELRQNAQEYRSYLDEMRKDVKEYKAQLEEMKQNTLDYKEKLEENDVKIHDVGVQIYRNVQAIVEKNHDFVKEEFKNINNRFETLQVTVETKNGALLPLTIITMILVIADLAINILHYLAIF